MMGSEKEIDCVNVAARECSSTLAPTLSKNGTVFVQDSSVGW